MELVQSVATPAIVRMVWPMAPSVSDPRRFPAVAVAVIAVMDEAMIELSRIWAAER